MVNIGITKNIFTDYGTLEKLNVLCTFSYENSNYFVARNENSNLICHEIKWNFWKGTFQYTGPVNNQVLRIAHLILRKAESNTGFYRFKAEHYVVIEEQNKYTIRKSGRLRLFEPYAMLIPFVSRLAVAILFALIYAFICVHTSEITVAANVFSGLPRRRLISLIYLIQVAGAVTLFLIRRFEWDISDLYFNAIIPYNVIALIGLFRSSSQVKITVIVIAAVSFLIWILPKAVQSIKVRKKSLKSKYWRATLHRCYVLFVICICVAFVEIHLLGVSVYTYSSTKNSTENVINTDTYFAARDGLENTKWCEYSNQEKVDLLQTICDYECLYSLGCKSPKVVAGYLERDTIYGHYDHTTNIITINVSHLENDPADKVLDTLLHESRHAYQHAVVKTFNKVEDVLDTEDLTLPYFQYALSYRENFDNYTSGDEDYYDYYHQEVESDSRTWAEQKVSFDYYNYIYPISTESASS